MLREYLNRVYVRLIHDPPHPNKFKCPQIFNKASFLKLSKKELKFRLGWVKVSEVTLYWVNLKLKIEINE